MGPGYEDRGQHRGEHEVALMQQQGGQPARVPLAERVTLLERQVGELAAEIRRLQAYAGTLGREVGL